MFGVNINYYTKASLVVSFRMKRKNVGGKHGFHSQLNFLIVTRTQSSFLRVVRLPPTGRVELAG